MNKIISLCSCKYELDSNTEKRILYTKLKKEATVSALEKLADMDGLTELTLNIRK